MKILNALLIVGLLTVFSMVSCVKDNIDDTEIIDQEVIDTAQTTTNNLMLNLRVSGGEGLELDCITVLYEFNLLMEDGAQISIGSDDDFWDLFSDSSNVIVDFVYPIDVTDSDGEEQIVIDAIELGELFASCIPDTGWVSGDDWVPAFILDENCFQFVYPVELFNEIEEEFAANNMEEFIDLTSTNNILFYSWPLELTDETGEVYTITSANEFFELMYSCEDYYNPCDSSWYEDDSSYYGLEYIGCYEILFPISVIDEAGDVTTLEDADAMMSFVFNGQFFVDFVYPFNLMDFDGNVIEVLDAMHLDELISDCWGGPNGSGDDFALILWSYSPGAAGDQACYNINYPITAIFTDSTSVDLNSDDELIEAISSGNLVGINLPLSVSLLEDGSVIEINSDVDLFDLLEQCSGVPDWIDVNLFIFSTAAVGDSACFEIQYPISMGLVDGTGYDINNDEEFLSFMESGQIFQLMYPITVNLLSDNSEILLNEPEDLLDLIVNCQ